ncbi:MAG: SH3 domain-containing protein [Chloroflexota bacterium]
MIRQMRSSSGIPFLLITLLLALVMGSMINADSAQESGVNWTASYYNSTDLSGAVVFTESLPNGININWGTDSPNPAVNHDNFSGRFTSVQLFNAGTYEFVISSDDGVRLFIDGVVVLDKFIGRILTTDRVQQTLTAGNHSLTVEYVEFTDQAALGVQWFQISGGVGGTPGLTPGIGLTPGFPVVVGTPTRIPPTALPPIPPGALSGTVIRATVLLVREAPFIGAPVVGRVQRGQTYQVLGRDESAYWFLIQMSSGQGWVWGYYLHVNGNEFNAPINSPFVTQGNPAAATGVVVQSEAGLRLRAAPTTDSTQIGRIPWGEIMPVISRTGDGWYQVVFRGTTGWVASTYVKVVEGDINSVPSS